MLQRALLQRLVDLPKSIEGLMTKDVYDKARAYALHKNSFGIIQDLYSKIYNTVSIIKRFYKFCIEIKIILDIMNLHYNMILLQIILSTYAYYYFWQRSVGIAKYYGFNHENEILISMICTFITAIFSQIINLPIAIYDTFVLEEKHGFNKQVRF